MVVKDLRAETRFPLSPVLHDHKVISGMTVMLRGRDRPYGVLAAHTTSRREFTKIDVDFLGAVANLLAAAIERTRGEEALRESERRFRDLVENVQLAAVMLNPRGGIIFCNDCLLTLTGWRREEVVGQNWFQTFLPPDAQETVQRIFEQAMHGGSLPAHYENEIETRKGDRHLIAWSNTVLRDPQGKVVGTMSFGEDITDRRRGEQALRDSEGRYRLLFESNPNLMWVIDGETLRFLAVNEAAVWSYGHSREEFLSMTIKDIRPPEDVPALMESLRRYNEKLYSPGVWRHRKKDGTIMEMEITVHTLTFAGRPGWRWCTTSPIAGGRRRRSAGARRTRAASSTACRCSSAC